jgi:peptidoglycan/LPS O-acetylase OafA/YrhL
MSTPPEQETPKRPRGRSLLPVWVAAGAVVGAMVGMALVPDRRGCALGAVTGAVTELVMGLAVNRLFHRRQGTLATSAAALVCGLAVGTFAGVGFGRDVAPAGAAVGLIVGALDAVLAWLLFPERRLGPRTTEDFDDEEETDPDADLQDDDA